MNLGQNARLLGYVQVQVGSQVFALPVQAVHFERDRSALGPAGGFFTEEGGQLGIIVDGAIIMAENIARRMSESGKCSPLAPRADSRPLAERADYSDDRRTSHVPRPGAGPGDRGP